jgi:zinc transport system substrate-binding protein
LLRDVEHARSLRQTEGGLAAQELADLGVHDSHRAPRCMTEASAPSGTNRRIHEAGGSLPTADGTARIHAGMAPQAPVRYRSRVRTVGLLLVPALLGLVPGCSKGCGAKSGERVHVTVSIFPIYDLVRRVAGPDADVALLLPPGHSEHSFDPTPKEIETAAKAKLGVMVGLGLDPWMERLMKDAAPSARLLKVGDRVPTLPMPEAAAAPAEKEHDHDPEAGALDPHVWLDPERARLIVRAVAEELGRVDAPHAVDYRTRATEIDGSLAALDKEVEERTRGLKTRGFVTFHGSFQYFAERYKLDILAIIEPYPGSQPSGEYVASVLKIIQAKKVPALFSEPQLDPRPAKVLAEEAKIPLGVLDPVGGQATTDSYEKLIRFDVGQLETHLR